MEASLMAGRILVPLKGSDRIENFLPYIEEIVKPGMKITFLVHYGRVGCNTLNDQLLAIHTGIEPFMLPGRNRDEDRLKGRICSAEKQIFPACASLRDRGVEVGVSVYAGALRRVVREYMQKEDVHLVMRSGTNNHFMRLLRRVDSILRFLKSPPIPPVLLIHPRHTDGTPR